MAHCDADELDRKLLAAHARADNAALVQFYTQAGDMAESQGQIEATCFYLTHAYVLALEQGNPSVDHLRKRLVAYGREK
ncbi:MAG: hypothetical protein V3U96_09150 [Paracoccaceae bacterium]